jgi:hypothetical protein
MPEDGQALLSRSERPLPGRQLFRKELSTEEAANGYLGDMGIIGICQFDMRRRWARNQRRRVQGLG